MRKNIIAIIFFIAIIGILFFSKKADKGADEKTKANPFTDIDDLVKTTISDDMSDEERQVALQKIEEEKKQLKRLAELRQKYFNLFGYAAPTYATETQLEDQILEKVKFNDLILEYIHLTGENATEGMFTTIQDIVNAISSFETNKLKEEKELKEAWEVMKGDLGQLVAQFIDTFKNDGSLLKQKKWNTQVLDTLGVLTVPEMIYADKIFADKKVSWNKKYGGKKEAINSILTALNTTISGMRSGASKRHNAIGILESIKNSGYTINDIDEYGNLKR